MIRFIATLVPVGYFLVLFCLPLVAVSTPSDAKVQFSNKKNFDRVTFEFETPAKFRSQKFGSQIQDHCEKYRYIALAAEFVASTS